MKLTRPHLSLLGIFLFSHIVGILAGYQYQQTALSQGTAVVNQQASSGFYLFGLILVATLLMILLYKFDFQRIIKLWFLSAIFITILLFFLAFFPPFLALGFAVAGFIVRKLVPDLWTRNLIDSLSYAGAGALFGAMIGVIPALILLGVLSLYDILSVFWTKHMVSLVKSGMNTDTFMGLVYPKDGQQFDPGNFDMDADGGGEIQVGLLGGGDIIIPLIFSISLIPLSGVASAVASSLGAVSGLGFLFSRSDGDTFYPAIPTVAIGAVVGWGLYLLIFNLIV